MQPCVVQKPPVHWVVERAVPWGLQVCSVLPLQVRELGVHTRGSAAHWPVPVQVLPAEQETMVDPVPAALHTTRALPLQPSPALGVQTWLDTHWPFLQAVLAGQGNDTMRPFTQR